jgi:hypothetical protein
MLPNNSTRAKLLGLAWGVALALNPASGAPQPFLPMEPATLLKNLPATPKQWTMKSSFAINNFAAGWVDSVAERDFTQDPPPPVPGVPPKPFIPATLRITVTDTGYKTNFSGAFQPQKGGGAPPNMTYFTLGQYPAFMTKSDDTDKTITLTLLLKERFFVEIRSTNLADTDLKQYAQSIDFSGLLTAPDTGEAKPSDPVILKRVDELHPEATRASPVFW